MTDVVANGETGAAVDNAEGKTYDEELVRVLMRHIEAGDLKSVQNSVSKLSVNCTLPDSLDTPLHTACFSGSREIVSWLLKKGANANAVNATGSTPLHKAAIGKFDQFAIGRIMITGGADPSLRNAMGLVAADLASNMRLRELLLGEELVEVLFRFPREKVPALIGRQGAKLQALQQQTGTVLFLPSKQEATPIVEISCKGTPAGLEMVKDRLLQMLTPEVNAGDASAATTEAAELVQSTSITGSADAAAPQANDNRGGSKGGDKASSGSKSGASSSTSTSTAAKESASGKKRGLPGCASPYNADGSQESVRVRIPKGRHAQLQQHEHELLKCGVHLYMPAETGAPAEMVELRGRPESLAAGVARAQEVSMPGFSLTHERVKEADVVPGGGGGGGQRKPRIGASSASSARGASSTDDDADDTTGAPASWAALAKKPAKPAAVKITKLSSVAPAPAAAPAAAHSASGGSIAAAATSSNPGRPPGF